jgi:osmotically-inducible protein OsmY
MKILNPALLSALIALGVSSCGGAVKTSGAAPDSTNNQPPQIAQSTAQENQNNATSDVRRKQLNSDIRAREQRNKMGGDNGQRSDSDIKNEVRSKLQANLPAAALAIDSKNGVVTVTGTVVDQNQLNKIAPLTQQIPGVQGVQVNAKVASAAKPAPPPPSSSVPLNDHTGK